MIAPAPLEVELRDASVSPELKVGGVELLDDLAAPWSSLCREAKGEPFLSPEWIRCYLQAFEPETEVIVIAVLRGERMLAVLPLTRKRIWYRGIPLIELKGAANFHSVWFDILRAPGPDGDEAIKVLWNYLRDLPGWHVLQLPQVPELGAAFKFFDFATEDGKSALRDLCADSPYMPLQDASGNNTDIFAGTTRKFRRQLQHRAELMIAELGRPLKFSLETVQDPATVSAFLRLEAAGWKGKTNTAIISNPQTLLFYTEIMKVAAKKGLLGLYTLTAQDRLIAVQLGLENRGIFHMMKIAYDETLKRWGPGHIITRAVLEDCSARRLAGVSFGGKAEDYKRAWTKESRLFFNIFLFNSQIRSGIVWFERGCLFPKFREFHKQVRALMGRTLRRRASGAV